MLVMATDHACFLEYGREAVLSCCGAHQVVVVGGDLTWEVVSRHAWLYACFKWAAPEIALYTTYLRRLWWPHGLCKVQRGIARVSLLVVPSRSLKHAVT